MRRARALDILGLDEETVASGLVGAYAARLSSLQQQLVSARSDAEQEDAQAAIAELIDAFELLGGARKRNSNSPVHPSGGTLLRPSQPGANTSPPSNAHPADIQPGDILAERYEVGRMLGRGGMGAVYEAFDRLKQEPIAIKVLVHELIFSDEAKERLLAEAKVTCNLSHPNIVRVYDVGVSGSHHFITMELLKGETLRQQMDRRHHDNAPYTASEIAALTHELIQALIYAHRFLVHRDIKPENIWLSADGSVKLMDFGIARVFSSSTMTRTGMSLGTAYYMAPEQLTGSRDIDWRADQYAIAVMLYEMLTGTVPVGAVKPLSAVRRDLPRSFNDAVMRALAPQRDDRFASMNEFGTALAQRSWRDSKARVGAVAVVVALLLIGGVSAAAFLTMRKTQPAVSASTQVPVPSMPSSAAATAEKNITRAPPENPSTVASAPVEATPVESTPVAPVAAEPAPVQQPVVPVIARSLPREVAPPPRSRECEEACAGRRNSCLEAATSERRACMRHSAFGGFGDSDVSSGMRGQAGGCESSWRSSADQCDAQLQDCKLNCG